LLPPQMTSRPACSKALMRSPDNKRKWEKYIYKMWHMTYEMKYDMTYERRDK
jgi:hypothetical protein